MYRVLLVTLITSSVTLGDSPKINFWDQHRKGANGDIADANDAWFKAAAGFGIEWVRLSPAGIKPTNRDPLIGNADAFAGIPPADLKQIVTALDTAQEHNIKVVLTVFSLPGCRWKQQNDNKFDYRLWQDKKYHAQSAAFWKELASAVKDHPAIMGYNLLNEPHPERAEGIEEPGKKFNEWRARTRGTAADLNVFYHTVTAAIREVDSKTPIILDGCFHASPHGLQVLKPTDDPLEMYAFHFYSPWNFTTFRVNKGRFEYPAKMPGKMQKPEPWTPEKMKEQFGPAVRWAKDNKVPRSRILLSEFGCDRRVKGAEPYLRDVLKAANKQQYHWAFYSFRSSEWDGMDYELGPNKLGWKYWQQREQGKPHETLIERKNTPLWEVIRSELKKR